MRAPEPLDYLVIGRPGRLRNRLSDALSRDGGKVLLLPRLDGELDGVRGRVPALILLGAVPRLTPAAAVTRLRRTFPLTDILPFAAAAEGQTVAEALRAGAGDFLVGEDLAEHLAQIERLRSQQTYVPRLRQLREQLSRDWRFEGFLSRSAKMWDVFELALRVADTDATVLIEGETGTGKELLARALVNRSARRDQPLLAVDCGALTDTLLDSELFGHERGAFTGASRRKVGLFEQAHGGTLLLDEIGNVSEPMQQRLLRVLETGVFRRVGGVQELHTDARILAATNANLRTRVERGEFRDDLFYRLNVIHLQLPPLRERPEDVLLLLNHFLASFARRYRCKKPRPSERVVDLLLAYPWPGNVRELQNLAERLVLVCRDGRILPRHLPASLTGKPTGGPKRGLPYPVLTGTLAEATTAASAAVEREYLLRLLEKHRGRIQRSADQAGISRRTLTRKLREHGIDKRQFKRKPPEST